MESKEQRKVYNRANYLRHKAKRKAYRERPQYKKMRNATRKRYAGTDHGKAMNRKDMRAWWQRRQKFLQSYKASKGCKRCPEKHPATLDFHHRDPRKKEFNIAAGPTSMKRLLAELKKCIVLCANCHRKEHYRGKI